MGLEFVEKMLMIFNEAEYQKVIKNASAKGIVIAGFPKNPALAPRKMVITKLKQKIRKKPYYEIFIEVFYELLDADFSDNEGNFQYIKRWKDNENEHDAILQELKKIVQSLSNVKSTIDNESIEEDYDARDSISLEDYQKVIEKNNELRERNKKLQNTVLQKKIEIDNLNKELKNIKKDYEKQNEEKKILESKLVETSQNEELLKDEIINKDRIIYELQIQNDELAKYRENAPRIVCFISTKSKLKFNGYNILFVEKWTPDVRKEIRGKEFDEIWYVHKGFQYNDFIEIKNAFSCSVVEFANISHLIQQKGGSYVKR